MNPNASHPGTATWSIAEIPYHTLARDRVKQDRRLFELLAAASFVEITSDLYTDNLVRFFASDDEVVAWLRQNWQHEEVQHGLALRRYVETAWPAFDWGAAYRRFFAEYSRLCAVELLAPTRALEMAARCVVETGTASFYRMLSDATDEPVLRRLAAEISADEVRHYKHFYRFFQRYRESERPSRAAILRTLFGRVAEVNNADALIAFKHVHLASNPDAGFRRTDYTAFRAAVRSIARDHYPHAMAVKMLLKPIGLGPKVARAILPATASATRRLFFR